MTKPTEAEVEAAAKAIYECEGHEMHWLDQFETDALQYRLAARAALTAAAQVRAQEKAKNCNHPRMQGTGSLGSDGSSRSTWRCPDCDASGERIAPPRSAAPDLGPLPIYGATETPSDDITVQCKCGWSGKQSALVWVSTTSVSFFCPQCCAEFAAFPATQDQGQDVLEKPKGGGVR